MAGILCLRSFGGDSIPPSSWSRGGWLWKERNSRTFDNSASTVQQVAKLVLEETDEWIATGFMAITEFLVVSYIV